MKTYTYEDYKRMEYLLRALMLAIDTAWDDDEDAISRIKNCGVAKEARELVSYD